MFYHLFCSLLIKVCCYSHNLLLTIHLIKWQAIISVMEKQDFRLLFRNSSYYGKNSFFKSLIFFSTRKTTFRNPRFLFNKKIHFSKDSFSFQSKIMSDDFFQCSSAFFEKLVFFRSLTHWFFSIKPLFI